MTRPGVASVLVGATKLQHLYDNLKAVDVRIGAEQIAQLNELMPPAAVYPNWFIDGLVDQQQRAALV